MSFDLQLLLLLLLYAYDISSHVPSFLPFFPHHTKFDTLPILDSLYSALSDLAHLFPPFLPLLDLVDYFKGFFYE